MSRVNIQERQPEAYNAMFALEKYLASSSIDANLREIIRVRASLLNGCKFCTGMHTETAKSLGVSDEKIAGISNWEKCSLFDDKEQAVLSMTDSVTHISANGLPEDVYQKVARFFSENEIAQLIVLIATINAWNRLGVSMAG